jgi:hypothetical protein
MNRAFAPRHNRVEEAETGEPREKVIKINTKKDKLDLKSKEAFKPVSNYLSYKTMGQTGHSFFDRKDFGLDLVEKKHATGAFQPKNELCKVVKQNSPSKDGEKQLINLYKNIHGPSENGLFKRTVRDEPEIQAAITNLIDHEDDVVNYLMEAQSQYRLPPICPKLLATFQIASQAIGKVCRTLRQRPETTLHAYYLLHFCCSKVGKKELVNYIVPCITIASKTEEYYPPPIEEIIKIFKLSTAMPTVKGFEKVSQNQVINCELDLLSKLSFKAITPPIMDIGNILLNRLGMFDKRTKTSLWPYIEILIQKEDAFYNSLVTLAVASMRLKEITADIENVYRRAKNDRTKIVTELSNTLLDKDFNYALNFESVSRLVTEAEVSLETEGTGNFGKHGELAYNPYIPNRFYFKGN